jgi:putative toxin-antitoxin system antitoxin component (TIGR02293 family)
MSTKASSKATKQKAGVSAATTRKKGEIGRCEKFSPAWVVDHAAEAPGHNLSLIERIRAGVKKSAWKQLIQKIDHTEKELEFMLPSSISSMQKKSVYDKETSERIYELAKLYGKGYDVFDTKADFKAWLYSPSKALGGKNPFDLLDSSFGFEIVEHEILRIQYNVYS